MRYIILIVCAAFTFPVFGNIIRVGEKRPVRQVKEALLLAQAGDTIQVDKGTYYEQNIIIDKPVVLVGIGRPVLDGEKKFEIISVKADHVTIDGFAFQHTGVSAINDFAAIKIYNRKYVCILNNIIYDAFFGIYSQYGTSCIIKNNRLTGAAVDEQHSGNGIHCWKSDSMQIIANTVEGHRDGIYFEFVTNSIIWRNKSFKNLRYGLHFMFSNDDAYVNNIFSDNGAGVAVMFSHGVKMFNNYFEKNWGDAAYGILLKEINDSYISGNHFEKNTIAIYAEGANRIEAEKNIFSNNGWAIRIQASCTDFKMKFNNFIGNTFDVATNGSLVLNSFDNNYWDKYDGYDLNRDGIGDVCYRPVSVYSMIAEQNPAAMTLFRSFITGLLDKTEKLMPTLIPENLKDNSPFMKPLPL